MAQALGLLKAGLTQGDVALEMGRSQSSIAQLAKKARELGQEKALKTVPGWGRKKLASPEDVRKMVRIVDKRPFLFAKAVKRKLGPGGRSSRLGG